MVVDETMSFHTNLSKIVRNITHISLVKSDPIVSKMLYWLGHSLIHWVILTAQGWTSMEAKHLIISVIIKWHFYHTFANLFFYRKSFVWIAFYIVCPMDYVTMSHAAPKWLLWCHLSRDQTLWVRIYCLHFAGVLALLYNHPLHFNRGLCAKSRMFKAFCSLFDLQLECVWSHDKRAEIIQSQIEVHSLSCMEHIFHVFPALTTIWW